MSIASLTASAVPLPSVASAATTPTGGAFGATLRNAMAGPSTEAGGPAQTAYRTEPGRGTPSGGHRHHHVHRGRESDATGIATAQDPSATGSAAPGQTSGGLLLSDMMRGLQAYGATIAVG